MYFFNYTAKVILYYCDPNTTTMQNSGTVAPARNAVRYPPPHTWRHSQIEYCNYPLYRAIRYDITLWHGCRARARGGHDIIVRLNQDTHQSPRLRKLGVQTQNTGT